jgi:hypothetical protein
VPDSETRPESLPDDSTRTDAVDAAALLEAAAAYLIVASFRRTRYPRFAAALIERAATLLSGRRCCRLLVDAGACPDTLE